MLPPPGEQCGTLEPSHTDWIKNLDSDNINWSLRAIKYPFLPVLIIIPFLVHCCELVWFKLLFASWLTGIVVVRIPPSNHKYQSASSDCALVSSQLKWWIILGVPGPRVLPGVEYLNTWPRSTGWLLVSSKHVEIIIEDSGGSIGGVDQHGRSWDPV